MTNFTVNLQGKSAIVTGAATGIGRTIALTLAAAGAKVCVNDINIDKPDQIAAEIEAAGGTAFGWQADVSNRFQVGSLIEEARDRFGKIDILINAAGVEKIGAMEKLDEWDWRRVLDVNLTGTFFTTQLMGRVMADEGGGTIINMTSSYGHQNALPTGISYVSSKAGVIGLTRQAAAELAPKNIRVNAVCTSAIITPDTPTPNTSNVPLGRAGTSEEVANVVLFLCSDGASFINGQAIHVNGGEQMP